MKKSKTPSIVTQAELATRLKVDRQRVSKWLAAGIITARPDRRIDLVTELPKATAYLKSQAKATALHSGKTALVAMKLQLQCQLLQAELDQVLGKVHGKVECCQSLGQVCSATSAELHTLHRRIATQFPEVPKQVIAAIAAAVDESIRRFKSGLAYRGTYHCPACNVKIDEYRIQPLPEDLSNA